MPTRIKACCKEMKKPWDHDLDIVSCWNARKKEWEFKITTGTIDVYGGGIEHSIKIKYCPYCGKKLKMEEY